MAVIDLADRHARHRQTVLLVAVGAYIGVSLMANVMSVRIVLLGPWAIDAGTFTYPLTFTLRDVVHKAGGRTAARVTIVTGAALNLVMVGAFWVAARLPAEKATTPPQPITIGNDVWIGGRHDLARGACRKQCRYSGWCCRDEGYPGQQPGWRRVHRWGVRRRCRGVRRQGRSLLRLQQHLHLRRPGVRRHRWRRVVPGVRRR